MTRFLTLKFALLAVLFVPCASAQQLSAEQREALLSLQSSYSDAISSAVVSRLAAVPWQGKGACTVELIQLPGGQVFRARLTDCDFPADVQNQVVALLEPANLPYRGFEAVFQRKLKVRLEQPSFPG